MADKAIAPQINWNPGECGSAANFFEDGLDSGRVGGFAISSLVGGGHGAQATGEIGDKQAVADKVTTPQIYGEPGKGRSAAIFLQMG